MKTNKTIRILSAKYAPAVKARSGITFTLTDVPQEYQAYQGLVVYKATTARRRLSAASLVRFGLATPDTMDCYLGIRPSGSFSII